MTFNRNKPYNDLQLLPPQENMETQEVLKKAISANRVLAELKGIGSIIPNQGMLVNNIVLQEARRSSEIENIVTTQDDLFQAAASLQASTPPEIKEVLRYREALWQGFTSLKSRPLSTTTMVTIAQTVKQSSIDIRKQNGTKIANSQGEVIYTPPDGEQVIRDKLENLEQFIHANDEVDPLIKLAIIHYQFEAIHPFIDGNGRTGRILNILYLIEAGLLEIPVLYLSDYIIKNKNDYYQGLRQVTEQGAWIPWTLYILDAIEVTATQTKDKIISIRELLEQTSDLVKNKAPKVYSKDLIDVLFTHPYCKIAFLVESGIAKRQTASVYLQNLEELGVLKSEKRGREVYYINHQLMERLQQ
ncbi:MAG: Fic family protein [SAR324 cluster bacterium]|nr:Fic family protein [SAR324 cluster bacterium]